MIKLQIIGRIGKDAEVKQVNGRSVINFSVAHSEKWKDQAGEQKEKTIWVDVAKWGDKTSVAALIKKGGQIYVEGTPEVRTFAKWDGSTAHHLRLMLVMCSCWVVVLLPMQHNPNSNKVTHLV